MKTFRIITINGAPPMLRSLVLWLSLFGLNNPAIFAHGDHKHEQVSEDKVVVVAQIILQDLIEKKKIDPTWRSVKPNKPYKKEFKKGTEWVITFDNPTATQKEKQKLYIFISLEGKLIAANFSGN